jgi:ribosomal protein S18 acetylase RimI-like enzyme
MCEQPLSRLRSRPAFPAGATRGPEFPARATRGPAPPAGATRGGYHGRSDDPSSGGEEEATRTHPGALAIRPYAPADWPAICRVHDASRPIELALGGVDPRAFLPMVAAAEADGFFDSETWVACLATEVVGFVSWRGPYVTWLYVAPSAHRRGVARRLLREALRRIGSEAWTTMLEGNEPALALYRAAGLEVVAAWPSDCEGYPCRAVRLALPGARMRDPAAQPV